MPRKIGQWTSVERYGQWISGFGGESTLGPSALAFKQLDHGPKTLCTSACNSLPARKF